MPGGVMEYLIELDPNDWLDHPAATGTGRTGAA